MRVCCKRLGARFTCKCGVVIQALRFQRFAAEGLTGLAILRWGFYPAFMLRDNTEKPSVADRRLPTTA